MATATAGISPGRNSLDQHRFVVAGATFDEFDPKHQHHGVDDGSSQDLSVASTIDVDNTHPYLTRYADIYAHDTSDASSSVSVGTLGPTFVGVNKRPPTRFKQGQKVLYTSNKGPSEAFVMKVMFDDKNQPHYTIKLASGHEEQTDSAKLNKKTTKGAMDENGEAPKMCVNFKTDHTPLFQSLYQGLWHTSQQLLLSNPEQARIWVARYAKQTPGSFDEGDVRWQLLPLHLFIALCGNNKEATEKPEETDIPHDEKNELAEMDKENEDSNAPPVQLLTALLSAYPQATQCTDDQNMIPLQSAIRGNVPLVIIEVLLEFDPSSVYRKDGRGRNAFALTEKVFGKHIHKKQVGKEDKARETRYVKLTCLLSDAARRVSSPAKSQPKENTQVGVHQKTAQEKDDMHERLQQLQNENLALRRENAELRHRSQINTNLLQQLVDKLQMYEDQRSIDIENYNEIFGSKDELSERRDEILKSISEDDDVHEEKTGGAEVEKERTIEEKQVGGDGAYHKRLERYLTPTPNENKGNINIISPTSTMTEATELEHMTSPVSIAEGISEIATPNIASPVSVTAGASLSPFVMMPSLKSSDEFDADDTAASEDNVGNILEGEANEAIGDEAGSSGKAPSESDDSSIGMASLDIFRQRENEAQDDTSTNSSNEISSPSDTFAGDVDMIKADSDAANALQSFSPPKSEPKAATDKIASEKGTGPVNPAISEEEMEQLCVE